MKTPAILLSFLLCVLVSATGCDKSRSQLVGKWKMGNEAGAMIWELQENGAAITGNTRGKYTLGDQGRIKIQMPRATYVYQVEFADGRMIWTDPNGSRMELTRVE